LLFIGFHTTFLIQHWIGVVGLPRRYYSYLPEDGVTWMNQVSTIGAAILGLSMVPFLFNVFITARTAPRVTVDDPWGSTAAAQLHVDPAYPLGGAGIRPQPPRGADPRRHRAGEGCSRRPRLRPR
jgi:heme/copper-type cytochrome/quinol oxidase subunit 1